MNAIRGFVNSPNAAARSRKFATLGSAISALMGEPVWDEDWLLENFDANLVLPRFLERAGIAS